MPTSVKYAVLYDGRCSFCTQQSRRLLALGRTGALELVDFQQSGALDRFPGITYEACMRAMHLITPEGKVFRGFEAFVQALSTRPLLRWPVQLYYVPGIKQLCDALYRWVAMNRYRLFRQAAVAHAQCREGTCSLHSPDI